MHKNKRKGTPRRRAIWLSLILTSAFSLIILLFIVVMMLEDSTIVSYETELITQQYLACTATHVYAVPLIEVEDSIRDALAEANIEHSNLQAYALNDMCAKPPVYRPGSLALNLTVPPEEIDNPFDLGLRIEEFLFAIEDVDLEQVARITLRFNTEENSTYWLMDRLDAFDNLGIVEPEILFEAGVRG